MRTFLTAARFYAGYKLKALSLLIFITVGLGLVMFAVDILFNSFNAFFDRPATYFLPRFFVSRKAEFDILDSNYLIADIALKTSQKEALAKALSKDFDLLDVAYSWAMFQSRQYPNWRFYALVIGIDFDELGRAFPYFKDKLPKDAIAELQASPQIMVERNLADRMGGLPPGMEFTLFSSDYFKDYNGIRVTMKKVIDTPMKKDDSINVPLVYIDIKHLRRLYAMPADRAFPFLLVPHEASNALSLAGARDLGRIKAAAAPLGLSAYSVATVSVNLSKTYELYRGVIIILSIILVLVMLAAISANLAINFQNRRADFGLMKAFGCSDSRLLGFVLCENGLSLGLPFALACVANEAVGLAVQPFKVISNFVVYPKANLLGAAVIFAAAVVIGLASAVKPYRYLRRIESVAIMREE
jgi:ABC-type lipoprotein release transport system permease subunit